MECDSLTPHHHYYKVLIKGKGVEKTIRVVITSGLVTLPRFLDALHTSLAPGMQQDEDVASWQSFVAQFQGQGFGKGTEVVFSSTGSSLETYINGDKRGCIASPALVRSLFEAYLGQHAVAPEVRRTWAEGLVRLAHDSSPAR